MVWLSDVKSFRFFSQDKSLTWSSTKPVSTNPIGAPEMIIQSVGVNVARLIEIVY
jgi:hypothetical protein